MDWGQLSNWKDIKQNKIFFFFSRRIVQCISAFLPFFFSILAPSQAESSFFVCPVFSHDSKYMVLTLEMNFACRSIAFNNVCSCGCVVVWIAFDLTCCAAQKNILGLPGMPVKTKCSHWIFVRVSGLKFENKDKKNHKQLIIGNRYFSGSKPRSAVCCPNLAHCSGIQLEAKISRN